MRLKRGDTVLIIAGKDRGKRASIEKVLHTSQKVVVTGLNIAKRHLKPSSKHPAGGIVEIAYPLSWSNVMAIDPDTNTPGRIGSRRTGGTASRYFKQSRRSTKPKITEQGK